MYYKGEGVAKNDKEALKRFEKAAMQGLTAAQRMVGAMYYHGQGVTKDKRQALKWYKKAGL